MPRHATQRRDSVLYEYEGAQRNLTEIARMAGMKPITLWQRMRRKGLSVHEALAQPVRKHWRRGA